MLPKSIRQAVQYNDTSRFKKDFKGPRYQKGILHTVGFWSVAGGGSVTFSTGASTQNNPGHVCFSGWAWQLDGGLDDIGPSTADRTPKAAGEWWSDEPEANIGNSYDVRALSGGTGSWSAAAASDDTWIQISSERVWRVNVTAKAAPDVSSASRTFEVRNTGSGSALDSAVLSAEAAN